MRTNGRISFEIELQYAPPTLPERGEADLAVGMVHVREEPVDRVRLGTLAAVEVDRQRRELAAVERFPRRDRRAARVERLLLALRQDVRLLLAGNPEAMCVRLEL